MRADDLILSSDTEKGVHKWLDGLETFCENSRMIVNETKPKVMTFDQIQNYNVYLNVGKSKMIQIHGEYC